MYFISFISLHVYWLEVGSRLHPQCVLRSRVLKVTIFTVILEKKSLNLEILPVENFIFHVNIENSFTLKFSSSTIIACLRTE